MISVCRKDFKLVDETKKNTLLNEIDDHNVKPPNTNKRRILFVRSNSEDV